MIEPPGRPTDVSVVSRTPTSVTIQWKAPESTGGRIDLFYRLWYQTDGGARTLGLQTNLTMGTITGNCVCVCVCALGVESVWIYAHVVVCVFSGCGV